MSVELIDPEGLPKVDLYRQVAVSSGTRLVHIAGQVATDSAGALVGAGDLAAQIEQCYVNVAAALTAVGGTFADVVDLVMYVAGYTPDQLTAVGVGMTAAASRLGITAKPPGTLIGVSALAAPEYLVELKVTAVLA